MGQLTVNRHFPWLFVAHSSEILWISRPPQNPLGRSQHTALEAWQLGLHQRFPRSQWHQPYRISTSRGKLYQKGHHYTTLQNYQPISRFNFSTFGVKNGERFSPSIAMKSSKWKTCNIHRNHQGTHGTSALSSLVSSPSGDVAIATEIVDLPSHKMVDLSIATFNDLHGCFLK